MRKKRSIIIAVRTPHLRMHIREVNIDDMKMSSNADTIELNRSTVRGVISNEISEIARNKRATEHVWSLISANPSDQGWPFGDFAKSVHGQKDITIAKFLEACNVNTMCLKSFNKNSMLRRQVNISPNIPDEDVDVLRFRLTERINRAMSVSRNKEQSCATIYPSKKKLFQRRRNGLTGRS